MKFATKEEIDFCIKVLQLAKNKIPDDSFSKMKVVKAVNHTVFELEEIMKNESI